MFQASEWLPSRRMSREECGQMFQALLWVWPFFFFHHHSFNPSLERSAVLSSERGVTWKYTEDPRGVFGANGVATKQCQQDLRLVNRGSPIPTEGRICKEEKVAQ